MALSVFAFLALLAPWRFPVSSDGLLVFRTAAALSFDGTWALPGAGAGQQIHSYTSVKAPDGGPGVVAVYAPLGSLYRAAILRATSLLPPGNARGVLCDLAIAVVNLVAAALTTFPLARLLRFGGVGARLAPPLAGLLLTTTFLGPLAGSDFQEPLLVLCTAVALERMLRARRLAGEARRSSLLASGLATGCALLAKPSALVLFPALLLPLLPVVAHRRRLAPRELGSFLLGAMPGVALFLVLNHVRFGSPFDLGYSLAYADPLVRRLPVAWTVLRQTLIPNRGLIWFAPLSLLSLFGLVRLPSGGPRLADRLTGLLVAGGFFAANAYHWPWEGGFGWGPRLVAPAVVGLATSMALEPRRARPLAFTLAALGLLVNGCGYLLDYGRVYRVAATRPGAARPLGPVLPLHAGPDGRLTPLQRPHYVPSLATWLVAPGLLLEVVTHGDGPAAGRAAGGRSGDAAIFRLVTGASSPGSDTGQLLMEDAFMSEKADLPHAVRFALLAIDFGGPAVETRALASYLLLRAGRPADAVRIARDGLALAPERSDLRRNLAAGLQALGREAPTMAR